MRYVYGQDAAVARFAVSIISPGQQRTFGPCQAIGVTDDNGKPVAAIVYNNFNRVAGTIEMSAAALPRSRWLSRETIWRAYRHPFETLKCQTVFGHARADDEPWLRILASLGHAFITVPRCYGRDADGVLVMLTVEEWQTHPIHQRCRRSVDTSIREAA